MGAVKFNKRPVSYRDRHTICRTTLDAMGDLTRSKIDPNELLVDLVNNFTVIKHHMVHAAGLAFAMVRPQQLAFAQGIASQIPRQLIIIADLAIGEHIIAVHRHAALIAASRGLPDQFASLRVNAINAVVFFLTTCNDICLTIVLPVAAVAALHQLL